MKRLLFLSILLVFSFSVILKGEERPKESELPRSNWMEGKYGLMVHWLAPPFDKTFTHRSGKNPLPKKGKYIDDLNDAVNGFNLKKFLKDFDKTGAEWLIFTAGHSSGTFASPNSVIDSLSGKGHTSERDLILEIAKALKKRGKRFIVYLPVTCTKTLQDGFSYNTEPGTDQVKFQELYLKAIKEWAIRYGENLDGWWFDSCYPDKDPFLNKYMKWEKWYNAARAGNENAVLAFNDGSYLTGKTEPIRPEHDYLSGEQLAIIDGNLRIGLDNNRLYLPKKAYVTGTRCLNHTLLAIDTYWAHGWGRFPDWANFPYSPIYSSTPDGMEPPVYTDEQLQKFVKNYTGFGGAITFNVGIFQEGHLGKLTIKQLQKLKNNYKKWK